MTLELRQLQSLAAIRDSGSMAAAAERLHLTQSALSHQIRNLEERYGCRLFARKSRPLRFTPVGRRLLALADEVLQLSAAAEREIERLKAGTTGRLHIAIDCHSCFDWLLPSMDAFREQWPEVEMDLSLAHSFDPLPALAGGELDLVITSDPVPAPGIDYTPLFRYEALLVIDNQHRLQGRAWIRPGDLAGETLITYPVGEERLDIYRHFLDPARVRPAGRRTAELTSLILQLVANGRGVAALPEWAIDKYLRQHYVTTRRLGKGGMWSTLYAASRAKEASIPFMQAFLDTAATTSFRTLRNISPAGR